jgi:hypothetical protein
MKFVETTVFAVAAVADRGATANGSGYNNL